jgi:heme-degrading monooxygenase HmoA
MAAMIPHMSVVIVNAITVPEGRGDDLAGRFAKRAGQVEQMPGFEEFQLLRPTDDRNTWLVYTRWKDQESFENWLNSMSFQQGHAHAEGPSGPVAQGSEVWQFSVEQQTGKVG